jgi:hypothetical protein
MESVPQKNSIAVNLLRPAFVLLEVPEGRHKVAHPDSVGVGCGVRSFKAPKGRHNWFALCRPSGA